MQPDLSSLPLTTTKFDCPHCPNAKTHVHNTLGRVPLQRYGLGLGNLDTLADHQTSVKYEHGYNRVELKCRALEPKAHGNLFQRPALVHPVRHDLDDAQRHGNGGALKVLALACRILWHHSNRDIESRQTCKTAEHEKAQE